MDLRRDASPAADRLRPAGDKMRKTNPILGAPDTSPFQSGADCAKRTQFPRSAGGPEAQMRKTNPISEKLEV